VSEIAWMSEAVSAAIGLVIGVVTSWFFERRATKAARLENEVLKRELESLREGLYTVGAPVPEVSSPLQRPHDLSGEIFNWVRHHQDVERRVSRHEVMGYFFAAGYSADEIGRSLDSLGSRRQLHVAAEWIEIL
jgi:hypothetical protein